MILPWGCLSSPSPVILLLPAYVCALVTPSQLSLSSWDRGKVTLPYFIWANPWGLLRREGIEINCGKYATEPGDVIRVCVFPTIALLKALILASSGVMQYVRQTLLGTRRSYTLSLSCFPSSINSFLLPKPGGYRAVYTPLWQGSPSHSQVCISNRLSFGWMRCFIFKPGWIKHSKMKLGGSQMLVECPVQKALPVGRI